MRTVHTFNAYHLGDNLVHLHFLRAMAKAYPDVYFTHGAPDAHLGQLYPLWQDRPNLRVTSISATPPGALNAWRGTDAHWYHHPKRLDFCSYHLEAWFPVLAQRMGLLSPLKRREDLQFDYPALHRDEDRGQMTDQTSPSADILVINSAPMSGQCSHYDPAAFDRLISALRAAGHVVAHTAPSPAGNFCTLDRKMDITAIGRLSQTVKAVVGVSTGPMWTTMNLWNRATVKLRLYLIDAEQVCISPNTVHVNSPALFGEILCDHALL